MKEIFRQARLLDTLFEINARRMDNQTLLEYVEWLPDWAPSKIRLARQLLIDRAIKAYEEAGGPQDDPEPETKKTLVADNGPLLEGF